jgi:hypothetical protein
MADGNKDFPNDQQIMPSAPTSGMSSLMRTSYTGWWHLGTPSRPALDDLGEQAVGDPHSRQSASCNFRLGLGTRRSRRWRMLAILGAAFALARHKPAEPLSITIIESGRSAEIVLSSARSGFNAARIRLLDSAGAPLAAREVELIAANLSAGVEPIRRAAEPDDAGQWRVDDLLLVPAGEWTIEVDALVSDFEKAGFTAAVNLRF